MTISLEDLKRIANEGQIISISHWTNENEKIEIKIKTLDISREMLIENSPISKILQPEVISKFQNKKNSKGKENVKDDVNIEDMEFMKELVPEIDLVCKNVLIEPTFENFQDTVPLNLLQKLEIFTIATGNIDDLKKNNNK